MDEALQRKLAANETLLREANEAIGRGVWPGEEDRVMRFRCECADLDCNQAVELTSREYEELRSHPRWFAVLDGHERPPAEVVVQRRDRYVVVEKLGEGGAMADATDPRG